ncbi:MAG: hypothetical protein ACI9U6_003729, partial [Loktanella salsilacus]
MIRKIVFHRQKPVKILSGGAAGVVCVLSRRIWPKV